MVLRTGLDAMTVALHLRQARADLSAFREILWRRAADGADASLPPLTPRRKAELLELAEVLDALPREGIVSLLRLLARSDREFSERLLGRLARLGMVDVGAATVGHFGEARGLRLAPGMGPRDNGATKAQRRRRGR